MSPRTDFFLDTEFSESAPGIELISIAMVDDQGGEFYAVVDGFDEAGCSEWVRGNVLNSLGDVRRQKPDAIRDGLRRFIGKRRPAFWGYTPAHDWVLFTWLWNGLGNLPKGWPSLCQCVRQLALDHNVPQSALPPPPEDEHNALADARWTRDCHRELMHHLANRNVVPRRSETEIG